MKTVLTPHAEQKVRALRRMKAIATGAFVAMTILFFATEGLGERTIFWVVRWDHVNGRYR